MVKKEYICEKGKRSSIIIEDLKTEIKEGATMILGFAGVGLIGPIVSNTLIQQIPDITELGFVTSEYLPPISVFYDGVLKHPFRIYYSPMHNLIVGISEYQKSLFKWLQHTTIYQKLLTIGYCLKMSKRKKWLSSKASHNGV